MVLIRQSLKRAPANLAQVSIFVRHKLLVAARAVDMDESPSQIVVCFAQAAIANENRFRIREIRAVNVRQGKGARSRRIEQQWAERLIP
jgi:hypothetical protein